MMYIHFLFRYNYISLKKIGFSIFFIKLGNDQAMLFIRVHL